MQPLIKEVEIKELLNKRLLKQQAINAYDLKMLYSVIKTPRLCDEFHKALIRKKEQDKKRWTQDKQYMECYMYLKS